DRLPGQRCRVLALDAAVEVPVVDHRTTQDAVAFDRERAVPGGGTRAAAVFGAFVDETHAGTEVRGGVGEHCFDQVEAIMDIHFLDRSGADDLDNEINLLTGGAGNVAHEEAT